MGRFLWIVTWERDPRDGDVTRSPFWIRFAIVGLAVLGAVALVVGKVALGWPI